jgi:ATP-dependent Lon protease
MRDDDPTPDGIYDIGTHCLVLQLLKLPDGTVKVLVEGLSARAEIDELHRPRGLLRGHAPVDCRSVEEDKVRNRGPGPFGGDAVRKLRQAQQEDSAGSLSALDQPDRGLFQARRHDCFASRHQDPEKQELLESVSVSAAARAVSA